VLSDLEPVRVPRLRGLGAFFISAEPRKRGTLAKRAIGVELGLITQDTLKRGLQLMGFADWLESNLQVASAFFLRDWLESNLQVASAIA
jgi:hypothetical protein